MSLIGIELSAPVIGQRPSKAMSGTAWLLFCKVPKLARGIRLSGLLPGAICRMLASAPLFGLMVPVAGQERVWNGPGAQSPSAAARSLSRWMLASARSSSGGPPSVL